ncbi:EAL domain-containing protein [Amphritea sp. HPY]|uniref:EAL domain-containing protein n=1 Tax=Amphritea sp. HPY TaxID=3421652 RepID=UPI003D7DAF7A
MTFKASKKVYIAILIYFTWVIIYLAYDYRLEKQQIYQRIDSQLEVAARAIPLILPANFHSRDMHFEDFGQQQDLKNILRLSEFTKNLKVRYIYSLIQRDDVIIFTSSSATSEELTSNTNISHYFDKYEDADPLISAVFETRQKRYLEIADQWGTFRTVFLPLQAKDGSWYIAAADIEISHIDSLLADTIIRAASFAAIFILFLIPFIFSFSAAQRNWARHLEQKVRERTKDLHNSERQLSSILEHSPVGIFHYDASSTLLTVNKRFEDIIGADESVLIGFNMLDNLVDPQIITAVKSSLAGEVGFFEGPYTSVTGQLSIYLRAEFVPMMNSTGEVIGGVGVFADDTEKENATSTLKKLSQAVEQSPNVVVITNVSGIIEYVNPRFSDITGYSFAEVIGKSPKILSSGESPIEVYGDLWQTLLSGQNWRGVFHNRKKNGELYWAKEVISPITDKQGEITHFIALQEDVTEVRRISDEMNYQTSHDTLTGLLNRREFEKHLVRTINEAHTQHSHHALCFIDIDQFKIVNDTCGYLAGDELLRQVSNLIRDKLSNRDTLARPGGDEFLLLMEQCSLGQAERNADQIMLSLKKFRFRWQDHSFPIKVSIGLTTIDKTTESATEALKQVDTACYTAKDAGRNRIHIYREDDELQVAHKGYIQWASEIREALDNDRFVLYAQQIQALQNPAKPGYEILIRLLSSTGKLVAPGEFLPAAERYNLAPQIDRWVIKNTLKWMSDHENQLQQVSGVAINLSGQSLGDESLLGYIIRTLESSRIPPQKIKFEITETAAIANLRDAQIFIKALRGLGCQFSLDDFGSGLSSFAYLKNLPVDYLKIDGMFVKDIITDPIDEAMVRSINEIGHIMGMQTIAEFVESEAIRQHLIQLGIDYAQGYAIHKPEPVDNILQQQDLTKGSATPLSDWQI